MDVLANSGKAQIGASGQITTFDGEPLTLRLRIEGWTIRLRWEFASDEAVADVAVEMQHVEEDLLLLRCVNFDGSDGRGTGRPLQIADSDYGAIFLHFRVFLFGKTMDRTIHYTAYILPYDDS